MIMAIRPATRKNPNDVIRYRWPMTLWSVEDSQSASTDPLRPYAGAAVVSTGCSIVVTCSSAPCRFLLSLLLRVDPLMELGRRHALQREQHPAVVDAAQLGAAAHERPGLDGSHLEVVRMAGDDITLE